MNGIEKKQMTLGELMAAVDAHKAENGAKVVLASYNDGELQMSVYSDGTVTAKKYNRRTTFNLDKCTDYTYHSAFENNGGATPTHIEAATIKDERWELRVMMEAEDRLWKNSVGRERANSWRF